MLGYLDGVPACEFVDEQTGESKECEFLRCDECILVQFLCIDCQRYGNCSYRNKPKILPSNRRAISLYVLSQKFGALPYAGGIVDQPHRLILQFQIIMDEVAKQEKIERENIEKKNRGGTSECQ